MQSSGTCVVVDACLYLLEEEGCHEVCVVWMLDLSHTISSTHSRQSNLRVELDSHADTCVVGKSALDIHEHPNVVMVSGFDPLQPPHKVKVVDAAIRYTCHDTGDHLILISTRPTMCPRSIIATLSHAMSDQWGGDKQVTMFPHKQSHYLDPFHPHC